MRRLAFPITVPDTSHQLDLVLVQKMSHYVMSRTEYHGRPLRREQALVLGNRTLDQVWMEIHSLNGPRVTITALLHGWPERVTHIEFLVPRVEIVVGPAVIEPSITPGDIVRGINEVHAPIPHTAVGPSGGGAINDSGAAARSGLTRLSYRFMRGGRRGRFGRTRTEIPGGGTAGDLRGRVIAGRWGQERRQNSAHREWSCRWN